MARRKKKGGGGGGGGGSGDASKGQQILNNSQSIKFTDNEAPRIEF